ncbi:hypothetical protein CEG14_09265 [Bordetella genomosp. 1]|uniref:Uncharacterized protein n=1 Tax=Bordetella genomosp. 1 TaxID=1395607 RepID=A0A261SE87_9BORD|nr:hypothetical protein [Bordetella genomosp. 1]MDQ8033187.1 hypothetical protein [Bordetella sp.]OZI35282.1 hypothetical protein CEG14_09265 [Bordetella genomosp. 1]OZI63823.1 hypothetical protein CAL27_14570 [Bordetella genomosp. 1]
MLHLMLPSDSFAPQPQYLHVPPKPEPIPPGSPPGDLPVDPDSDEPEVDLPPGDQEAPKQVQ